MKKTEMNNFRLFILINFILIFFFLSCKKDISRSINDKETVRRIVILYTNDEHGWLEESETTNGAAKLMGIWRNVEKYTEDSLFLILSGGDMWTGPAISTWFKGQSMAEVMNAMNYRAAAIGNHEFDFKIEGLKERITNSNFPFLSANIREKETGEIADIAIPYIIEKINDVKVGIIGLTTTSTRYSAFPDYVKNFDFISYDEALEEIVPQVKENGAELLIVIGHICFSDMHELAETAANLGITLIGGGHCHELVNEKISGVSIIEAGSYMRNYAKVEILFDSIADTVVSIKQELHENQGGTPNPEIQSIVTYWQNQADAELSQVIGYVEEEISQNSDAMYNMVTDSWLFSYPKADISLTNRGGIRQSISAGDITKGTIIGVLPFSNDIIELELTGAQLIDCTDNLVVGGMTTISGYFLSDSTPIYDDTTYSVLTTDYLYIQPDSKFKTYDPDPYYTSLNYHQPTIDWIISHNTSINNPLDTYLDTIPRQ